MFKFKVHVRASKAGSIGAKYNIGRDYVIEAESPDQVNDLAIRRAHDEGLEHVIVSKQSLID